MLKLFNLALLVAALCGAVTATKERQKITAMRVEHQRLKAQVGHMPITDESKIHVLAIDTGDPLHFLWRFYLPANLDMRWQYSSPALGGGSNSRSQSGNPEAKQLFLRYRMRVIDGQLMVFSVGGGSGISSVGGRWTAKLAEHVELLRLEQLATDEVKIFDKDDLIPLLEVYWREGAEQQLDDEKLWKRAGSDGPLISFRAGSKAAWAKSEKPSP